MIYFSFSASLTSFIVINHITSFKQMYLFFQGRSHCGRPGGSWPPTSISEPKKVQHFQFQKSEILPFMGVQKLYGVEISRFLPCMLQFSDNLQRLFIFSNYIRKIDHLRLDLLRRSNT